MRERNLIRTVRGRVPLGVGSTALEIPQGTPRTIHSHKEDAHELIHSHKEEALGDVERVTRLTIASLWTTCRVLWARPSESGDGA